MLFEIKVFDVRCNGTTSSSNNYGGIFPKIIIFLPIKSSQQNRYYKAFKPAFFRVLFHLLAVCSSVEISQTIFKAFVLSVDASRLIPSFVSDIYRSSFCLAMYLKLSSSSPPENTSFDSWDSTSFLFNEVCRKHCDIESVSWRVILVALRLNKLWNKLCQILRDSSRALWF